ncbi:Kelch repeat-containing protein [Streptomyces sp. NPDC096136]|uniref:Kelch repeat-containing protein n=1 Tax=Streptomyces sp. NPDC096136 TaxID=3366076 RepID=UPI0037F5BBA2
MTSPITAVGGSWRKTGDLPLAASWYGQYDGPVLLDGRKVFVAGGTDATGAALDKTALYDPVAGKWTAGRAMGIPRRHHTVTRLGNGKVLVVGGTSAPGRIAPALASAQLYDPAHDTWTTAASLREARWDHCAVLLADRTVLVCGGVATRSGDSLKALRTAEIYHPDTDTWSDAAEMNDARSGHGAVLFKGGRVLVCGGTAPVSGAADAALAFCELYTPATAQARDTWTPTGSMAAPRSGHQTVPASETTALVVGGALPGVPGDGTFDPHHALTLERFDLAQGRWTALPPLPGRGREAHRLVPLGSGSFLLIGGTGEVGDGVGYQNTLLVDAATGAASPAAAPAAGRWALGAVALAEDEVLVTGGTVRSGLAASKPGEDDLTATTEVFGPAGSLT